MNSHMRTPALVLAALAASALLSSRTLAQSRPQEVLDLIAAYEAIVMKVRPLQDRIVVASSGHSESTGFRPEGTPARATVATAAGDAGAASESRVAERLRHRDRAVSTEDDATGIAARLTALERKASAELERISGPGLGTRADEDGGSVRFGDGRVGARPPPRTETRNPAGVVTAGTDERALAAARRTLAELQREYDALEREVGAIEPH